MKTPTTILLTAVLFAFTACEPKTPVEKVKDKVDDALDRRPNEKLRDAGEDLKEGAKDTKDAVKEAAQDTKEAVKDAVKE